MVEPRFKVGDIITHCHPSRRYTLRIVSEFTYEWLHFNNRTDKVGVVQFQQGSLLHGEWIGWVLDEEIVIDRVLNKYK